MIPRWVTFAYLAYLALPMALLFIGSFGELWLNSLLPTGVTGKWYREVASDPSFRRAFGAGTDIAGAAALALMITAACAAIMTTGEWFGSLHERHL